MTGKDYKVANKYVKLSRQPAHLIMVTTLLITEDDELANELVSTATKSGLNMKVSKKVDSAEIDKTDIVIFDTRFSDIEPTITKPVIGLSTNQSILDDKLMFYDDLIFTPVDLPQLGLRIKRLLLKSKMETDDTDKIKVDDMTIDLDSFEVSVEGRTIQLTFKEYELLKYLASNRGRAYDRQTLLNQIWDYDYYGGTRTVDVHVRRLRAKLGTKYGSMIETVRQVGYRFAKE